MKIISMTNVLRNFKCIAILVVMASYVTGYGNDLPIGPKPSRCLGHFHFADGYFDFCDTCGCGSSGGSLGYGTGLNNNFLGLRYIG